MPATNENALIQAIAEKATEPYNEWKIGITSTGRANTEGIAACAYVGYTREEVIEAFDYFTKKGMIPIHMIGLDVVNLYIFNINGIRVSGEIPIYDEEGLPVKH